MDNMLKLIMVMVYMWAERLNIEHHTIRVLEGDDDRYTIEVNPMNLKMPLNSTDSIILYFQGSKLLSIDRLYWNDDRLKLAPVDRSKFVLCDDFDYI